MLFYSECLESFTRKVYSLFISNVFQSEGMAANQSTSHPHTLQELYCLLDGAQAPQPRLKASPSSIFLFLIASLCGSTLRAKLAFTGAPEQTRGHAHPSCCPLCLESCPLFLSPFCPACFTQSPSENFYSSLKT